MPSNVAAEIVDGHAVDARGACVLLHLLQSPRYDVVCTDLLHQVLVGQLAHRWAFVHPFRHGLATPLPGRARGFTPARFGKGQLKLDLLVFPVHEVRALLALPLTPPRGGEPFRLWAAHGCRSAFCYRLCRDGSASRLSQSPPQAARRDTGLLG